MKYTFMNSAGNEQTIKIPDDFIARSCKAYGISKREAIDMYLSDEGYIENETVTELTAKAKGNTVRVNSGERKKRERKPDIVKRELIQELSDTLNNEHAANGKIKNVRITNVERVISFEIGDDTYELTLSRKRKPKD